MEARLGVFDKRHVPIRPVDVEGQTHRQASEALEPSVVNGRYASRSC